MPVSHSIKISTIPQNKTVIEVKLTTCFHEFSKHEFTKKISSKYYVIHICFDIFKGSNLRKNVSYDTYDQWGICFCFQLRNIGEKFVDSYSKNSWKHVVNSLILSVEYWYRTYVKLNYIKLFFLKKKMWLQWQIKQLIWNTKAWQQCHL